MAPGTAIMAAMTISPGSHRTPIKEHTMQNRKPMQLTWRGGLAALLLTTALPLLAHEGELRSAPANGATLESSPDEIGIEFEGEMRITQFDVVGPNGRVRLADTPGNAPTERYFVAPADSLPAGTYEVSWRGLARDGHMMSDGFRFTIED